MWKNTREKTSILIFAKFPQNPGACCENTAAYARARYRSRIAILKVPAGSPRATPSSFYRELRPSQNCTRATEEPAPSDVRARAPGQREGPGGLLVLEPPRSSWERGGGALPPFFFSLRAQNAS